MKFQGSIIEEQGVTFAIVIVKKSAMGTTMVANKTQANMQAHFPGIPVVLASQDLRGIFQFQGRKDLVNLLTSIDPAQIPWKEYTV